MKNTLFIIIGLNIYFSALSQFNIDNYTSLSTMFSKYLNRDKNDSIFVLLKDISGISNDSLSVIQCHNNLWIKKNYFYNNIQIDSTVKNIINPFADYKNNFSKCNLTNITFMSEVPCYYYNIRINNELFSFQYCGFVSPKEQNSSSCLELWNKLWRWN